MIKAPSKNKYVDKSKLKAIILANTNTAYGCTFEDIYREIGVEKLQMTGVASGVSNGGATSDKRVQSEG